ncbi:flagellar hook-associated protein FlgK [Priestia filamentosa]|uniref:flagellar hook-associated protein FlgK n=1 Tax=Priestia filamentosa TaxID=1402861 RepID=UPI000A08938C|nr:flagellar hook-associated protein FlgK [Priestia filamentosa]MDT3765035.1 flagellar hook-associated protein FlgK [Priestia filamentosa]OXS66745.1 flagellar hook-associated protein FlgK [Priestia filamentosa]WRU95338.1 flagellar hook-associated protein FlgK [Priestia filamentosa]SMF57310.1 flagellar hook-associated protein 1 FlgK [Priestia filamentosa]
MRSTFQGLETSLRALHAQQAALQTTGQNVANANTAGYTRQRANLQATSPYPSGGMNSPQIAGTIGTGVEASSIERIRDQYLDAQYRSGEAQVGYADMESSILKTVEAIMNDQEGTGLSGAMDEFWSSLQDLSINPNDEGIKTVVREKAVSLTDTFHYLNSALTTAQKDLQAVVDGAKDDINSIAAQIADLNQKIGELEPSGYLPNDLYDQRDLLVDKLSSYMDIKVECTSSGSGANRAAAGIYTIKVAGNSEALVQGNIANKVETVSNGSELEIQVNGTTVSPTGSFQSLIHNFGTDQSIYKTTIDQLDQLALTLATEFNNIHGNGYKQDGEKGSDFFMFSSENASSTITLSDDIMKSTDNIAVGADGNKKSDGGNAAKLAELLNPNVGNGTIRSAYSEIIGEIGVKVQNANRLKENSENVRDLLSTKRDSVSSVSLDEEMTNMIKFQHAYNAAARSMTVMDEMLDRIINNMGVVGR